MDGTFDMNTTFTPMKSRSNIWIMLSSINKEKYSELLMQKGVDFHTFANLSRDDMRLVGILNHEDQEALLGITKPMSAMYQELSNDEPIKWPKVINNIQDSMQTVGGALVSLKNHMLNFPVEQSLVDPETTTVEAMIYLLELIDSRLNFINTDLNQFLQKNSPQKSKLSKFKRTFVFGLTLVGVVTFATYVARVRS